MSDLILFVVVAAVTYASRAVFMIRPREIRNSSRAGVLGAFPLALFVSLAAVGTIAPSGSFALNLPVLAASLVGVAITFSRRRNVLVVMGGGLIAYWLLTWLT